ncbi:hypothetical protein [Rubellicoccus peritrichatus]|uniref:Fibronectin type-III domain-containing protein n=1 Tax=Rubellicoccus peritrichatus TaxID=3080537 RepID=A0AAQ3L6N0_9BACT|nr:hypothetical protein [Puniceicoccus sp. CR14]WOO39642.1 hypothetical protein RZN69_13545 [Puniceicoccus sp. CR14]
MTLITGVARCSKSALFVPMIPMLLRFNYIKVVFAAASLCLLQLPEAFAVQTDSIQLNSFNDFIAGELENVSISSLGEVQVSHELKEMATLEEDVIFEAAVANDGTIYVSTGNQGLIYSISEGEEPEVFFTPPQVLSHGLVVGPDDAVYVGTSPSGRVYRIVPGERPEVYFDPDEMYIWDLLFDDDGALYVATGSEAKIYRVPPNFQPNDEAEVWFTSDRSRVTTLAFDHEGKLLAGAGPKSYLYRISGKDEGEVLFNAGTDEISGIWADDNGDIYFSTLHRKNKPSGITNVTALDLPVLLEKVSKASGNSANGDQGPNGNGHSEEETPSPASAPSFLYRFGLDGFAEPVWSPGSSNIFSFIHTDRANFLAGTDDNGRFYEVTNLMNWSLAGQVPNGGQVSEIVSKPDGGYLLLSSNPAGVYTLSSSPAESGTLTTDSLDAGAVARWGRLLPLGDAAGPIDGVSWQTRTGNASEPDETWSDWEDVDGLAIKSPHGRYLRVKAEFSKPSAILRELRMFYIFNNTAPIVNRINVLPVGLQVLNLPPQNKPPININALTGTREIPKTLGDPSPPRTQVRLMGDEGFMSFGWNAFDANRDYLSFSFSVKRDGDDNWALLASDIDEQVYSLNTRGMNDGYYRAKVTASDAPSNPPGTALEGSLVSSLFLVDNLPPSISLESKEVTGSNATLRFSVSDTYSIIDAAYYILDGGKTREAFPEDLMFDSTDESFEIVLNDLSVGEHTLVFEVMDEARNVATGQFFFSVE